MAKKHMIDGADLRAAMVRKRLRKAEGLAGEIASPKAYGSEDAEVTLVGWGSTYGALKEAVDLAIGDGLATSLVHFSEMWPFPAGTTAGLLTKAKRIYTVENNATAQLARVMRAETGLQVAGRILKFDGRPYTPAYILRQLKEKVR
jgi:2-oxoglutarate ferredoxin oxidoreductase subunit alpha